MKSTVLYLILMVFGLLAFGCSKGMKSSFPSNGNNNGIPLGQTELLSCIKMNGALLPARVETDNSNIAYTYLKFISHPSEFEEADVAIRFFSGIDTNSISAQSSAFVVIHSLTQQIIGSSATGGSVDRAFLNSLSSSLELNDLTFQVNVGPNARVLRVSMHQDSDLLEQTNSLIPSIDANPNSYATNHPQSLVNMHPLLPYSNSGWTNLQFRQQGTHLCTL